MLQPVGRVSVVCVCPTGVDVIKFLQGCSSNDSCTCVGMLGGVGVRGCAWLCRIVRGCVGVCLGVWGCADGCGRGCDQHVHVRRGGSG